MPQEIQEIQEIIFWYVWSFSNLSPDTCVLQEIPLCSSLCSACRGVQIKILPITSEAHIISQFHLIWCSLGLDADPASRLSNRKRFLKIPFCCQDIVFNSCCCAMCLFFLFAPFYIHARNFNVNFVWGFLFIAVTCKALCNTVVNIATLITFNFVIYMPDPLCSC